MLIKKYLLFSLLFHTLFFFPLFFFINISLPQLKNKPLVIDLRTLDLSQSEHLKSIQREKTLSKESTKNSNKNQAFFKDSKIAAQPETLEPNKPSFIEPHSEANLKESPLELAKNSVEDGKGEEILTQAFNKEGGSILGAKGNEASTGSKGEAKIEGGMDKRKEFLKINYSIISEIVKKHLNYPLMARRIGWEGMVVVSFLLTPNGQLKDLEIEKSSGYELLDKNTLETIKKCYSLFPIPPMEVKIVLPVSYKLK